MEVLSRAGRGIGVTVEALDLVRRHRGLLLPITVSATVSVGYFVLLGAWIAGLAGSDAPLALDPALGPPVIVAGYVVAAVLATAANVATVVGVQAHFDGRRPTLAEGLAAIRSMRREVLLWGLISSGPGLVFGFLDRYGVGPISSRMLLGGGTWSAKTFFTVPVLLSRDARDLSGTFDEAATTFRQLWPDSGAVSLGVDTAATLATLLGLVVVGLGVSASSSIIGVALIYIGIATLWAILLARHAAVAVTKATLYRYSTGDRLPVGFEPLEPERLGYGLRSAHGST